VAYGVGICGIVCGICMRKHGIPIANSLENYWKIISGISKGITLYGHAIPIENSSICTRNSLEISWKNNSSICTLLTAEINRKMKNYY